MFLARPAAAAPQAGTGAGAGAGPGSATPTSRRSRRGRRGGRGEGEEAFTEVQARSYAEIRSLLLSAGFFRVRDPSLGPFRVVIGGLSWLINSCGRALPVDVFTKKSWTLGAKITAGEQIVEALREMHCPQQVSSHQIQGNDMPIIFTVVQWLVKQLFFHRKQYAGVSADTATLRFAQSYKVPDGKAGKTNFVGQVMERYKPERKFRRNPDMWQATLTRDATVISCLLEYGEKITGKSHFVDELESSLAESKKVNKRKSGRRSTRRGSANEQDVEKQLAEMSKAAAAEEAEKAREAAELAKRMKASMAASGEDVSGANVGRVVGLQGDAMRTAAEAYSKQSEEIQKAADSGDLLLSTRMGKVQAHKRRVTVLTKSATETEARTASAMKTLQGVAAKLQSMEAMLAKATAFNERVLAETAKLEQLATASQHQEDLGKLRKLVTLNESLKSQESAFRNNCKNQLSKLNSTLSGLAQSSNEEEDARLQEIEDMFEDVSSKYDKFRHFLSTKNQDIARLSRAIDDVPTRSELIQYERRFVELYDQVARKLDETRKYYETYNMLVACKDLLSKEEKLIGSISSQFAPSMRTKSGARAFVSKCGQIVEGLQQTLATKQASLAAKEMMRDTKQAAYQALIEEQRAYFRAVKEFQLACDKNEQLLATAQAMQGKA